MKVESFEQQLKSMQGNSIGEEKFTNREKNIGDEEFTDVASNNPSCFLPSNNNTEVHTIFLCDGWRKILCRCVQCSDELNLTSMFDDDDAIQKYEKQALAKSENLDADKIIADSLANLCYVRKLEVSHDINEFKKSLGDFLREKANTDDVLTAEDVTTFFTNLKEKRKENNNEQRSYLLIIVNSKRLIFIDILEINMKVF
ncbi:unnamed protein product [Rotaria sp. Silwood2]|nr:unnamed protein product [Rotaria sp. Silwood2]